MDVIPLCRMPDLRNLLHDRKNTSTEIHTLVEMTLHYRLKTVYSNINDGIYAILHHVEEFTSKK